MTVTHAFAGVCVTSLATSLPWYERLFGRSPDLIPNEREAAWQVRDGAWLVLIEDRRRAGTAWHTLLVDDLNRQLASLAEHALRSGTIEEAPGLYRRTELFDPDGNRLAFAEVPAPQP